MNVLLLVLGLASLHLASSDPGACNGAVQPILPNSTWVQAEWRGAAISASNATLTTEGNFYFPQGTVNINHIRPSSTGSNYTCPWKGFALYYDVLVDGQLNVDAAWSYVDPCPAGMAIKDHFAFWKGVTVVIS